MNLAQFLEALGTLVHLPKDETEHIRLIATGLDDENRARFLDQLKILDRKIDQAIREEEANIVGLQQLNADMQKKLKKTQREEQEEGQKIQDEASAEEQLSGHSHSPFS